MTEEIDNQKQAGKLAKQVNTSAIVTDWGKRVAKIPREIVAPTDRERVVATLTGVMSGLSWTDIACGEGLTLAEHVFLKRVSALYKGLADEAQKIADDVRQLEREEAAHDRAVLGPEIPVFSYKGEQVGSYRKPSDSLLTFLMKSDNPEKYGDRTAVSSGGVVLQVNLGIPSRIPIKEKPVYEEAKLVKAEPAGALSGSAPGAVPVEAAGTAEDSDAGRSAGAGGCGGGSPGKPGKARRSRKDQGAPEGEPPAPGENVGVADPGARSEAPERQPDKEEKEPGGKDPDPPAGTGRTETSDKAEACI